MKTSEDFTPTKNSEELGLVSCAIFIDTRRPVTDKSRPKSETYPVKIRVTYRGNRVYYSTGAKVTKSEWLNIDSKTSKVWTSINVRYKIIKERIDESNGDFSFDKLNVLLGRGKKSDVMSHFETHIKELKRKGLLGTAITYECAMSSIKKYWPDKLSFDRINKQWLEGYEQHMKDIGNRTTTRSIYLRALRALINRTPGRADPMGNGRFEIKNGSGRSMAMTKEQINRIFAYDIVNRSTTHKCKDLFEFSYRCNGINFKDMIALQWKDIVNNEIIWLRAKTERKNPKERFIHSYITEQMQVIIDRWGNKESKYVFGFLNDKMTPVQKSVCCKNIIRLTNKHLKIITDEIGLPHVSTYTARHSFASVLNTNKVQISAISELMGHSSILQTQSYIGHLSHSDRKEISEVL